MDSEVIPQSIHARALQQFVWLLTSDTGASHQIVRDYLEEEEKIAFFIRLIRNLKQNEKEDVIRTMLDLQLG
jgi:hypothetical protein